ncbi:hypothetical protein AA0113_g4190 [Alternaria arborescens]|uniref:NmrA-like domain-containing protein n=1 Tax=Alternaria arborescens TaxID=156630 RepID=A0A4Q4SGX3_9PLEO|nr:hypothetical protein AA0111_g1657 [Alternaria arborescens]RYN43803.1 hypothetical protein AA0112_g219 [Alternaria arborescens]RYO39398.1 hypothetical protein AA0111_g1657 [Alternaria arborescens]RYO69206.1 hypothetical protein AA0113_g4190 [Alternaria arborescens]
MVVIAIAGGANGLGRTIAETVLRQGKHQVKILSRSANPKLAAEIGCEIIAVDYDNIESMKKILEENDVHTVISTIFLTTSAKPQNNLVMAADASKVTKRFVPSIWGVPMTREQADAANFIIGRVKSEGVEVLKKTSLEHTRFYVGFFLDYWGYPHVPTHVTPLTMAVDMQNEFAALPGTGSTPISFIHTVDIAKFVAASLDLPQWDEESYILGDRLTWNDFVKTAEEVKGTKFRVTYDSIEKLKTGTVTELETHKDIYPIMPKENAQLLMATFGKFFHDGVFDLKPEKTLNQVFPEIKVSSVRDVLQKAWGNH